MSDMTEGRKISFHFHPYQFDQSGHAVEKSVDGRKRKYLKGIASGPRVDAHGERMSQKAIEDFMRQANSGDILLYADQHGIRASEDIGILSTAEVTKEGDWYTEYRLYDEADGVDDISVQRADKLWKQATGQPPYTHARQKGFSIEGLVPEQDGGISHDEKGKTIIERVDLDGVVVVPRPAYRDSIANAVYKALGEQPPWQDETTIMSRLKNRIEAREERETYHQKRFQLEDALWELVEEAMNLPAEDQRSRLEEVFREYDALMIDLILSNPTVFSREEVERSEPDSPKVTKSNMLRGLMANLEQLENLKGV